MPESFDEFLAAQSPEPSPLIEEPVERPLFGGFRVAEAFVEQYMANVAFLADSMRLRETKEVDITSF
ncbi:MAG: hypothetical protein ACYS7M_10710 [Planctomycetota bacterium]|jgi:hypothetical protein